MKSIFKRKIIIIISVIVLISAFFFVFFKFFINNVTVWVVAPVTVLVFFILLFCVLINRDVIYDDFFVEHWGGILFSFLFCSLLLAVLFLRIEGTPPQKTVELIQSRRSPDIEYTERVSCDFVHRFIKRDVSLDTIKHYRYNWGIRRNHSDTIKHKKPSYSYTNLGREYSLMPDTIIDGLNVKCGEGVIVDVQKKYFEGSKAKPFTRFIVKMYTEKGVKTISEFENKPISDIDESNLYDLFFDGAQAQWSHTVNVPRFYCSLASGKSSGYYTTYAEAQEYCDEICKKAADKLLSGFDYTQYKACLSTMEIYRNYKEEKLPCGVAKVTVNRNRGFLSRKPYSCNSTGTWEMIAK